MREPLDYLNEGPDRHPGNAKDIIRDPFRSPAMNPGYRQAGSGVTSPVARSTASPALSIRNLNVRYGRVPILHDLSLRLDRGVLAIVGRNGMGKSTLCKTIMGLVKPVSGEIASFGQQLAGLASNKIANSGIAYVPQGRRVWPSLSVDEHLRLVASKSATASWTVPRIYETFPRLHERRRNNGSQLSGGEQQMLAISRGLLQNPKLMIMDEPTEGLAPVIVQQVEALLSGLAQDGEMSILLIEQNLGVALDISDDVAIMMHGRIARVMPCRELAADADLQRRLLGVGRDADEEEVPPETVPAYEVTYIQVRRSHGDGARTSFTFADGAPEPAYSASGAPNRWSNTAPQPAAPTFAEAASAARAAHDTGDHLPELPAVPIAAMTGRNAYVVGTFDTKRDELVFISNSLKRLGVKTVTVDLATSGVPSPADIAPRDVAAHHPGGAGAVFTGDRGASVTAMALAFERFIRTRGDIGGIISAGGSGGTALATAGMRALPIGIPKFMVSTVASGDVSRYVGPSDITMMYSVTDVQGINSISEQVLSNAANALAGMIAHQRRDDMRASTKTAIGLTMFGLTTPCVQAVTATLKSRYDCLVFHATGTGGQSMEKLVDSKLLAGVIDATTTEVADYLVGGVFPATPDRFGAMIRTRVPTVISCGALDMVNFGARDTVPSQFSSRRLYVHNPNVTLMRTTPAENEAMARFIADRVNRMEGPVRFLIPEGGVSGIDAPGKPFHDPAANRALFGTLERMIVQTARRKLIKLPYHINDRAFSDALVKNFLEIMEPKSMPREAMTGAASWRS